MVSFPRGLRFFFKRPKVTLEVSKPLTRPLTDPLTGAVIGLERPFMTKEGKEVLARLDYLPGGERKITIFNEKMQPTDWGTKKTTVEPEGSVFGGKKITIEKDYTKRFCYGKRIHLTKEYSKSGVLEHKDLFFQHSAGNAPLDYTRFATQDRVFAEYPLTSSYEDMLINPSKTKWIQHQLIEDGGRITNNYGNFTQEVTNYERVLKSKKMAEEAKIAEAEAAKVEAEAAKAAEAAKLAAESPRVNVGKIFNKELNELKKVQEEVLADGTTVRKYAAKGKDGSNQYIITKDKGNYHEEYIVDAAKDMEIRYKQLGENKPEIEMRLGREHHQTVHYEKREGNSKRYYKINKQTYDDGLNKVDYKSFDDHLSFEPEKFQITVENQVISNPTWIIGNRNRNELAKKAQELLDQISKTTQSRYVDLVNLFKL